MNERFTLYVTPAERGGFHATMHGLGGAVLGVALNKATRIEALAAAFNEGTRHDMHGTFLGEEMKGSLQLESGIGLWAAMGKEWTEANR